MTERFWFSYGYASVAFGMLGRFGGVRFRCWSKIVTPSTKKLSSLKPTPAPNENAASPVMSNIFVSAPSIGMLMPIPASWTLTSTAPLGSFVNVAVPWTVRMPAALRFSSPITCVIAVAVANGMLNSGVSLPLNLIGSVTERPLVLTLIVMLPVIVRPGRPTKLTAPVAKIAYEPGPNEATPSFCAVITSPTASGLTVPSASRYGPAPKKTSTSRAP